jgi:hypothetical protein
VETTIEDIIRSFLWECCYSIDYIPVLDQSILNFTHSNQISAIRNALQSAEKKSSSYIQITPRFIPIGKDTATTTPPLCLPHSESESNPIKLLFVRKVSLPRVFISTITTGEMILDRMFDSSLKEKLGLLSDWERYDTDRILHRNTSPGLSHRQENLGEIDWQHQIHSLVVVKRISFERR